MSAFAFTASNTFTDSAPYAGAGSVTNSGYVVTQTSYTFSEDGLTMTKVEFDLDHLASDVKVALTAGAPVLADWSASCTLTVGGTHAACTFPTPVAVASGVKLSVAAVSSGSVVIEA